MAKESLQAGKHLFLEKPIALELWEADELISIARAKHLLFTIGYSQRFNPKFAYVKRSIDDGTIGQPVSALVSRHITRNLGKKLAAASSSRPRPWKRPTTSISCCGALRLANRFAFTR